MKTTNSNYSEVYNDKGNSRLFFRCGLNERSCVTIRCVSNVVRCNFTIETVIQD